MSSQQQDYEQEEMPRFTCRLPIPANISEANRMLLEQLDIIRQEIAYVYKKSDVGRRALIQVFESQHEIGALRKELEFLKRIYWIGYGVGITLFLLAEYTFRVVFR